MLHRILVVLAVFSLWLSSDLLVAGGPGVEDAKWMEIEGVSVPVPPAEHPRLFLRARDLDDLRSRVEHPLLKPVWEDLQQLATRNKEYQAQVDALRYLLNQDRADGRRAIETVLDTMSRCAFSEQSDVTRPIGRMLVAGAVVYDWCYDLLTPGEKEQFLAQFIRLAEMLECGYPPHGSGNMTGHQSEWMIMRDMLSAGIAAYDEYKDMYHHASKRIFSGLIPARNFWYPGHAFHQGTAYAETRCSSSLYPLWIFDRMGAGNVYHPSQQFLPYHWAYVRRPDGKLLNAGDNESKTPRLRSLLNASYYGDGYVLSDYLKTPGINGMNKFYELLWRDPDLEPKPLSDLPLSRYFGYPNGWMVARTGWEGEYALCEMKLNIYSFGNHHHLDAGHFSFYYKGPLAMDTGLYSGTDGGYISSHNVNYYKRTIAHNSLLIYDPDEDFNINRYRQFVKVSDGGQRFPNNWREPRDVETMLTKGYKTGEILGQWIGPDAKRPDFTYLKGDITEAYSDKVEQVRRSFVFLNFSGGKVPAALVVFDRIVAANPDFKKTWLLHSEEEPLIDGNTTTLTLSTKGWSGKLVNTTLIPEQSNAELTTVGGPGKEFWVAGKNFENKPRRTPERYEMGNWRVELSPREAAVENLFLNLMQVTDGSNKNLLEVERIDSENLVGIKCAGRVVLFNRSAERADRTVSWQVDGGGTFKFLVTDLAEGNWQLRRDGRIADPVLVVNADNGTACFEGPAGSYELRR